MLSDVIRDPASAVLIAIVLTAFSGVPGLLLRSGSAGQRLATSCSALAALLAIPAAVSLLLTQSSSTYVIAWNLPFDACEIAIDPLTAFFLIPVFLVFLCGSTYATGYWPAASHRDSEPWLTFNYGMLAAAMALVVIARNGVLFLVAWEIMALSAYFLLITEHNQPEVRRAGIVYLIATHTGTAALFVLFSLLRLHGSSFLFPPQAGLHVTPLAASLLFIAALIGFGSKAGLMPLHIWLPSAHANAPSHVSAMLSGVMLKMGIYGLLRIISFVPQRPLWWGALLAVTGLVSAFTGICLAASQSDIKRLLAYSSIENIGIITTGIGIALIGQTTGNPALAYLGMAGSLLHILNHSFFKPLLFMCAGAVIHSCGSRKMDMMGGLAKRMPWSAFLSLCGAIAICGLPPFNGFVSEFLLYLGFFGEATSAQPYVVLGAPVLALVGGVALVCFVKLYGAAFLGSPRSARAEGAHEAPLAMLAPMTMLALACMLGGVAPQALIPLAHAAMAALTPFDIARNAPQLQLAWFTFAALGMLVLATGIAFVLRRRLASLPSERSATWGCGYLGPTARMQYSATSFSEFLTTLMRGVVRTRVKLPRIGGFAPKATKFSYTPEETLLDRLILPLFHLGGICFAFFRRLQSGQSHIYMLYIFVTLLLLMLWMR